MAFTIKIYEKNEYISGLLKKRLTCFFPDAYIVNPYFDDMDQVNRFSDYGITLFSRACHGFYNRRHSVRLL